MGVRSHFKNMLKDSKIEKCHEKTTISENEPPYFKLLPFWLIIKQRRDTEVL